MILYQNMILRESGQLELALSKLEENASQIVDRVTYMETRGKWVRFVRTTVGYIFCGEAGTEQQNVLITKAAITLTTNPATAWISFIS